MRKKWKRALALVLAASMVASSNVSSFADAGAWPVLQTSETSTLSQTTGTPSEANQSGGKEATPSDAQGVVHLVTYTVTPEDKATVTGSTEVNDGKDLKFKVKPESGWEIVSVTANGTELEGSRGLFGLGKTLTYVAEDVKDNLNIEITAAESIPRTMLMSKLLAAAVDAAIPVSITGAGNNDKDYQLPAGAVADNAPAFEGFDFVKATVGNDEVVSVGTWTSAEGIVYYYYTTTKSGNTAMLLQEGQKIVLHYQTAVAKYSVSYEYAADTGITVEEGLKIVPAGGSYSFAVTPSAKGKDLIVTINGKAVTGTVGEADLATGRTVYLIQNVQENQVVNISEKNATGYTFTYNNSKINNGSITSPESGSTVKVNGTLEFVLKSEEREGIWPLIYWHLNQLAINGYYVDVPLTFVKGAKASSTLPTGEKVTILLTDIERRDRYVYTVTIENVHTSISVTGGNFKDSTRDEMIVKKRDGVKSLLGYDPERRIWVEGSINQSFYRNNSNSTFYLNLNEGYTNPKVTIRYGESTKTISVTKNTGNQHRDYDYTFNIQGNNYTDNIEIFVRAERKTFRVLYQVEDAISTEIVDNNTYSMLDGNKNIVRVNETIPSVQGKVFEGWSFGGKTYQPNEIFTIDSQVAGNATENGEIILTAILKPTGESNYVEYIVEYYFQNPSNTGKYVLDETKTQKRNAIAGSSVVLANALPEVENYIVNEIKSNLVKENLQNGDVIEIYYDLDPVKWAKVTFVAREHGSFGEAGNKVEIMVLKNGPLGNVIPTPVADEHYVFDKWTGAKPTAETEITGEVTYTANFKKNEQEWATVTFQVEGGNGKLDGSQSGQVLKGAKLSTVEGGIPTAKPATGYHAVWTPELNPEAVIEKDATYTVKFEKTASEWATVTFTAGEHGGFVGEDDKMVIISILKGTALGDMIPEPVADEHYVFDKWTEETPTAETVITDAVTYTANFKQNETDWAVVTFKAGENGTLSTGNVSYTILKQTALADSGHAIPKTIENEGYVFYRWEPSEPNAEQPIAENITYTALFAEDKDGDKTPDVAETTVSFKTVNGYFDNTENTLVEKKFALKDEHGQYSENGSYVLAATDVPVVGGAPLQGYLASGSWNTEPSGYNVTAAGAEFTYTYAIDAAAWVSIKFTATEHGSLKGGDFSKVILKGTSLKDNQITVPETIAEKGYAFSNWEPAIPTDTEALNENYEFKAYFAEDKNGDGKPDKDQTITITFDANGGTFTESNEGTKVYTYIPATESYESKYQAAPSAAELTAPEKKAFDGWTPVYDLEGKDVAGTPEVTMFKANWAADENGDHKPDYQQYAKVTFHSDYGFDGNAEQKDVVLENLVPGTGITVPTPIDTDTDKVIFTGWQPDTPFTVVPDADEAKEYSFTAIYEEDKNNDGKPDKDQLAKVTFHSDYGFDGNAEQKDVVLENLVPSTSITVPTPIDTDTDNVIFKGWQPETPFTVVPDADKAKDYSFTAVYEEDKNNDNKPDKDQLAKVMFHSDYGFDGEAAKTDIVLENLVPGTSITVPTPVDTDTDNVIFTGWQPETPFTVVPDADEAKEYSFTAVYEEDKNNDGKPDKDQTITITFDANGGTFTESNEGTKVYTYLPATASYESKYQEAPGATALTAPEKKAFDGWTPVYDLAGKDVAGTPEVTTFKANWAADENGDHKPDYQQYAKVTFHSDYGFNGEAAKTDIVLENLVPGTNITVPTPVDTDTDNVIFTGWQPETPFTVVPNADEAKEYSFTAIYEEDKNNDNKPDKDQLAKVTFHSDYGFDGNAEQKDVVLENLVPGTNITVPTPVDTDTDNVIFTGWQPETPFVVVPDADEAKEYSFTAVYEEDKNNDNKPDKDQLAKVTFHSDYGFDGNAEQKDVVLENLVPGTSITVPTPVDTDTDNVIFTGWQPETPFKVVPDADEAKEYSFTAIYEADTNNDGKPDKDQLAKVTFHSDYGFDGNAEQKDVVLENLVPGTSITVPTPVDTDTDNIVFAGWTPETPFTIVPNAQEAKEYGFTAVYKEDLNNDGKPDENQHIVKLTFEADAQGVFADGTKQAVRYAAAGEQNYPAAPEVTVTNKDYHFAKWTPFYAEGGPIAADAHDQTFTAVYGSDSSNDGTSGGGRSYTSGGVDGRWVHVAPDNAFVEIKESAVPQGMNPQTNPEWFRWKFVLNNGTMLANKRVYIKNPYAQPGQPGEGWFCFGNDGLMYYGWYMDTNGKWYYLHGASDGMLGTMMEGWYDDPQDGKRYYLAPGTGEMQLGWKEIGGKWYYFNQAAPEKTWTYDEKLGIWLYNGSKSRPYGSMYRGEQTPDGYTVGGDGAWIK